MRLLLPLEVSNVPLAGPGQTLHTSHCICFLFTRLYRAGKLDVLEEFSTTDRFATGSVDIVAQLESFSVVVVEVCRSLGHRKYFRNGISREFAAFWPRCNHEPFSHASKNYPLKPGNLFQNPTTS